MVRFTRSHQLSPGQLLALASSRKNVSDNDVSPSELSTSLFDLHSLDTELLPKECIRALANDENHIPFWGIKLTEVRWDSFVNNSSTIMISCISRSSRSCEHTLNTLRCVDRMKSLSKGSNSKKDFLFSTANLRESTALPISSTLPSISSLKDDTSYAWFEQIQGKDYEVLEESYEQVKLPSKKITSEDKMRKANGQTKWKDLPKVDHKNTDSDGDLNGLLQEMNLLVEVDQPGNQLNGYITRLDAILSQKAAGTL